LRLSYRPRVALRSAGSWFESANPNYWPSGRRGHPSATHSQATRACQLTIVKGPWCGASRSFWLMPRRLA